MDTFFITPRDELAPQIADDIRAHAAAGNWVSPRGSFLDFAESDYACVYGLYAKEEEDVGHYYDNGGVWDYVSAEEWIQAYDALKAA